MATSTSPRTITIPARDLTVSDRVVVHADLTLTITAIRPDTDADAYARVITFDNKTEMWTEDTDDIDVQLPRPLRYSMVEALPVDVASGAAPYAFTIVDNYNNHAPVDDHEGWTRAGNSRCTIMVMRDQLNLAHQLGVDL